MWKIRNAALIILSLIIVALSSLDNVRNTILPLCLFAAISIWLSIDYIIILSGLDREPVVDATLVGCKKKVIRNGKYNLFNEHIVTIELENSENVDLYGTFWSSPADIGNTVKVTYIERADIYILNEKGTRKYFVYSILLSGLIYLTMICLIVSVLV